MAITVEAIGLDLAILPLWQQARWRPRHQALLTPDEAWSSGDLASGADAWAAALADSGLGRHAVLGSLLENGSDAVLALLAAWRSGAVYCPFNTRLSPVELRDQHDRIRPRLTLTRRERLASLGISEASLSITDAWPQDSVALCGWAADGTSTGCSPLALDEGGGGLAPAGEPTWPANEDAAVLLFTSGSSGRPKVAVLTHGALQAHAAASALRLGCLPEDVWLAPLPLFHIGAVAIVVRTTMAGSTMALSRSGSAEDIAWALDRWPVTVVSLVPTQLRLLLDLWPGPPPRRLRVVLLGGAAADAGLLRAARERGWPIAVTYGLTEAGSQVATTWPTADPEAPDDGAPPLPFTTVEVRGTQGRALPAGQVGDVWVRGPGLMRDYLDDAVGTNAALVDGWLRTGDLGHLDPNGRLHVDARREDLIVSGGENIYPAEVEAVLTAFPGLLEACVVGLPEATWGQTVAAAIVPTAHWMAAADVPLSDAAVQELNAWLAERLAAYKRPRRYKVLPSLPRTASGKVSRAQVRRAFLDAVDA